MDAPTTRSDWRLLGRTLRLVLGHPTYGVLAIVVGLLAAIGMSVTGNLRFVLGVLVSDSLSAGFKAEFLLASLPFLGRQFGTVHGVLLYAIAAFTGAAVALLAYHLVEHDRVGTDESERDADKRDAGVVAGVLSACSVTCGPGILAGIVALIGSADVLATLRFEGLEGSMLAVVMLVLSTYWLAEAMRGGEIRGHPVERVEPGLE